MSQKMVKNESVFSLDGPTRSFTSMAWDHAGWQCAIERKGGGGEGGGGGGVGEEVEKFLPMRRKGNPLKDLDNDVFMQVAL